MNVRELAFHLTALVLDGKGELDVFKSEDDEGNGFTHVSEVALYYADDIESQGLWIEEPRPADEDHVVLW